MSITEVQAAVERVTEWVRVAVEDCFCDFDELATDDLAAILSALAASEARRGELEGELEQCALEIEEAANVFAGSNMPNLGRVYKSIAARHRAALNPQQEGSRDHG